ncbi:MAG: hypothetical protein JWQ56_3732 [Pseudarthrobacter sp.]|nr:hypothetical protein [Pseudarthrobacter sp.]
MNTYPVDPFDAEHKMPQLLRAILGYGVAPAELVKLAAVDPLAATKEAYEGNWAWLTTAANQVIDGEDAGEAMAMHAAWEPTAGALLQAVRRQLDLRRADAINSGAEAIIEALRAKVFEPNVARLIELSEDVSPGDTVQSAVGQEQFEKAAKIKEAERVVHALTELDGLRKMLHPGAFDWTAAFTKEADGLESVEGSTKPAGLTWWLHIVTAGATLHYPTLNEAMSLHNSPEHQEYREALEAAEAEDNPWVPRRTGSRWTARTK